MSQPRVQTHNTLRVEGAESHIRPDLLAVESPLIIKIGFGAMEDRKLETLALTMRTPGQDLELTLGWLIGERIIQHPEQVLRITHCEDVDKPEHRGNVVRVELKPTVNFDLALHRRNTLTSASCGICGTTSIEQLNETCAPVADQLRVDAGLILRLPEIQLASQPIFSHTGGLHAVGWFNPEGSCLAVREDIGRHNALDKVIGTAMQSGQFPLSNTLLLLSGRVGFELVQKAWRAGCEMIAAIGAPSSLAVETAKAANMTLVGFIRGGRYNVYHGAHRILSQTSTSNV
ncbi:formate dehydrogenase accessory sulfurtransferase FdhD [Pontibacter sp. G13]|uniref:formate dehydrogenase accessory sulfurtransferase FdhD n=1 Tax=Pontibacter sp. G13 TaxID=3074898 RepID=UPI00288C1E53|nr:formate dehydrogenase accessory sulfurtransferase FdhD [Pontibacter sp. G13]WNJ17250.1 formate dehydrogenase accessory sulfurtransferase FdhD [Pontibacter sp. G13]